jgi:hypothetical protein
VPCVPYASLRAYVSNVLKQALNRDVVGAHKKEASAVSTLFFCVAGPLFFFVAGSLFCVCGRSDLLRLPA